MVFLKWAKLKLYVLLILSIFVIYSCNKSPYKKAKELFNRGEYTEASKILDALNTPNSFYLKSRIYIITGKYDWVEDTLKKIIAFDTLKEFNRDTIISLFDMYTQKLWDEGATERAIADWAFLLKYDKRIDIGRGFYPLAMESLRVIKETFPSYEAILLPEEKERINRTLFYLINSLSLENDKRRKINIYNGIVDLFMRLHDYSRALNWINNGISDIGNDSGLRVKKGLLLFQLIEKSLVRGDDKKAMEYTSMFIANGSPQNLLDDVYYIRGNLFYKKGMLDRAKSSYEFVMKMHLYDSDPLKKKAAEKLKIIRSKKWEK